MNIFQSSSNNTPECYPPLAEICNEFHLQPSSLLETFTDQAMTKGGGQLPSSLQHFQLPLQGLVSSLHIGYLYSLPNILSKQSSPFPL